VFSRYNEIILTATTIIYPIAMFHRTIFCSYAYNFATGSGN